MLPHSFFMDIILEGFAKAIQQRIWGKEALRGRVRDLSASIMRAETFLFPHTSFKLPGEKRSLREYLKIVS